MKKQPEFIFTSVEEKLFEQSGIAAVYLFGSHAQGVAQKGSDFDFAILLENPRGFSTRNERNQMYDRIYDFLEPKIGRPCNIDIVFLHEASLQLQFHVVRDGKLIYEGRPKVRADYHERIVEAHADFEPHRKIFQQATLARI